MSATSWIRVSVDMAVDAKILELTYAARWSYIEVLIAAKRYYNGGRFESRKVMATCVDPNAMRHVDSLLKVGLLAQDDDGAIIVLNWEKYQTDPTGKERQKRHRDKVKSEKVNRDMYVIGSPENEAAIAAGILPPDFNEPATKLTRTSDGVATELERNRNETVLTSYEPRNESSVKTPEVTVTSLQETKTETKTKTNTNNLSLTLSFEERLNQSQYYQALNDDEKRTFKDRMLEVERRKEETIAQKKRSGLRPLSLQDIVKAGGK
jgi:hypothetical protein